MAIAVYLLGALVTLVCAVLLLRRYATVHLKLLLWSGLCFAMLTLSNVILFVDLVLIPGADLYVVRLLTGAIGMALLLYGLIWESE